MSDLLSEVLLAQKGGRKRGLVSICSAHPDVLQAAIRRAAREGTGLLVESTCNQVNQFGGYTGMTPADFVRFVGSLALKNRLAPERLLLGGDHLGPSVWQAEPAEAAMEKAEELVCAYARAGYAKLHLDASMRLGGDPPGPLEVEMAAQRAARLAAAAEGARRPDGPALSYVIGTEVPLPGGAQAYAEDVPVTSVESVRRTIEASGAAFARAGLDSAWERVRAVVVQPGVEFGDDFVLDYRPEEAAELSRFIETTPFVYEAHSTDYQTRAALQALVRDHFAILKIGPALTFALRQAMFALAGMEAELFPPGDRSELVAALEQAMLRRPEDWQMHYHGSPAGQALARKYSLSDRARYYWTDPQVQAARGRLLENLQRRPLPWTLVSQFAPQAYEKMRLGQIEPTPGALLLEAIDRVLDDYAFACGK
jgi:D-tagatose-bisphosphate aldolase class II non-catalytic subunit